MKSILLSVTNQQLQQSISDLQTKINNFETIKEVQDKIISYQDHQISFLNDSISRIWIPITVVAGIIGAVFIYVSILNGLAQRKTKQAQDKMDEAALKMDAAQIRVNEAEAKMIELNTKMSEAEARMIESDTKMSEARATLSEAEQKIDDLNRQLQEAGKVVGEAKIITETAQENLTELEVEQKQLKELTTSVEETQKLNFLLIRNRRTIEIIVVNFDKLYPFIKEWSVEQQVVFRELKNRCQKLSETNEELELEFVVTMGNNKKLEEKHKQDIDDLSKNVVIAFNDFNNFMISIGRGYTK